MKYTNNERKDVISMSLLTLDVFEEKKSEKSSGTQRDAVEVLYQELNRGIQSMRNGEVYTIEEAWEEIDKI